MEPILFKSDTTIRWSCRQGDFLIWFRFSAFSQLFSEEDQRPKVIDIWEMKDGNFVTLTNRWQDLPSWFELHPLECSGSLVYRMQDKLNEGYNPPDPVDGPNLWRVLAGDRLVWIGKTRPDLKSEDGLLSLVDFRENALVVGEPFDFSSGFPTFGGFLEDNFSPEATQMCRNAMSAVVRLGVPRVVAADDQWRLG